MHAAQNSFWWCLDACGTELILVVLACMRPAKTNWIIEVHACMHERPDAWFPAQRACRVVTLSQAQCTTAQVQLCSDWVYGLCCFIRCRQGQASKRCLLQNCCSDQHRSQVRFADLVESSLLAAMRPLQGNVQFLRACSKSLVHTNTAVKTAACALDLTRMLHSFAKMLPRQCLYLSICVLQPPNPADCTFSVPAPNSAPPSMRSKSQIEEGAGNTKVAGRAA